MVEHFYCRDEGRHDKKRPRQCYSEYKLEYGDPTITWHNSIAHTQDDKNFVIDTDVQQMITDAIFADVSSCYQIGSHRELSLPSNCDEILNLLTPGQQVVGNGVARTVHRQTTLVQLDHTKPGCAVGEWHRSRKHNSYRVG